VLPFFPFFSSFLAQFTRLCISASSGDAPHSRRSCGIKIRAGTQLREHAALRLIELLGRDNPRHCF
jgi:hypothetical protein